MIKKLRSWVGGYRSTVWCLGGCEKHSEKPLKIIYMGSEKNKNYLKHIMFGGQAEESCHGKRWVWDFPKIQNKLQGMDMKILEEKSPGRTHSQEAGSLYAPCWVVGHVDVADLTNLIKGSSSIKEDMRKIRKYGLSFEISNDKDRYDEFFNDMYMPYISKAHGNRTVPISYDVMMKRMGISELLLIKREGEFIGGEILVYDGPHVRAWSLGVKNGDYSYVKMGVIGAMYYFRNGYLKEKGYRVVNVGASRAFLNDGVLQYKKKWGVTLDSAKGGMHMHVIQKSTGVESFFRHNPFITVVGGELVGVVFADERDASDLAYREKLRKKYYIGGMGGLDIRSIDEWFRD